MKNSAQLYLYVLAALRVGQSLAADISPQPLFIRSALLMGDPGFEVSGLGKRLSTTICLGATYQCPDGKGCCDIGTTCVLGTNECEAPCEAGATMCSYGGCCKAGYACMGPGQLCQKFGGSTSTLTIPGNTIVSSSTFTIPGNTIVSSSTSTIPGNTIVSSSTSTIPGNTFVSSSTTTIPTTKAATSGTTILNTYTIPIKPTSTIANSVPTPPSMTPGGYSSNSTVSPNANSSSIAIIPIGGGNSLKPGAWLGALGAVFFFAFFHM